MTLQHRNRMRQSGGKQVIREVEATATGAAEMASSGRGPSEFEIRQRAHEIYLSRNGAPGDAVLDWLQAETELRTRMVAGAHRAPTSSEHRQDLRAC